MRTWTSLLPFVLVVACSSPGGVGDKSTASAPPPDRSSPAPRGSNTARAPRAPDDGNQAQPEKITSAIRDASSPGETKDGATLASRVFVSRITSKDELHVALELRPEQPIGKDHPWVQETIDMAEAPSQLRFEISGPGGKVTLQGEGKLGAPATTVLTAFTLDLFVGTDGMRRWQSRLPWKAPPKELFGKPGDYEIVIAGDLKTSKRTIPVRSGPLKLQVVGADAQLPLEQLEALAADAVKSKRGLSEPPRSTSPIVDDVDGNLWFRFQVDADNGGHTGYDVNVVEVLLDPKGEVRNYDSFSHFTCVAQGTRILTPTGDRAVEVLHEGDVVVGFDPEQNVKTTAIVEHVTSAHVERTLQVGDLRVTGSHPLWADGAFVRADQIEEGARLLDERLASTPMSRAPREIAAPTTVYELTVSAPHTYFAGGLLVHNKAVHNPVGGQSQPWHGWFFRRAAKH